MSTKKRYSRIVKYTLTTLWWCVLIALFALILCILGAKMRGEVPKVFGYSVLRIVSGSMEPDIPTGSFILIKECDPSSIARGDIISFYSDDPSIKGYLNTHIVCDVPYEGEQGLLFPTMGVASGVPDPTPARADAIVGVYVKTLGGLTAFSDFLSNAPIIPLILGALMLGMVLVVFAAAKASSPKLHPDTKEDSNEDDNQVG